MLLIPGAPVENHQPHQFSPNLRQGRSASPTEAAHQQNGGSTTRASALQAENASRGTGMAPCLTAGHLLKDRGLRNELLVSLKPNWAFYTLSVLPFISTE